MTETRASASTLQTIANRFPQVSETRDLALVAIALGSNLGNPHQNLIAGLQQIHQSANIAVVEVSPCFWTDPIYPEDTDFEGLERPNAPEPAPPYLNGTALLETSLQPAALMAQLLAIEAELGRTRPYRWASRTLDLDILLWQDLRLADPSVYIPHPRMHERPFVLVPLQYLVPQWQMPAEDDTGQMGVAITELAASVGTEGVNLDNPVNLNWQSPRT